MAATDARAAVVPAAGVPDLGAREMSRITRLVYERSGITLHDGKRALVVARLQKRIRTLGLTSFREYVDRVARDASGDELTALLDAIATNHTSFFREEQHFSFLASIAAGWRAGNGPLRVWSAACSTGEEPYSIAITLRDLPSPVDFSIVASDLSTKALKSARAGVYKLSAVERMPTPILRRHFERGLGEYEGFARVSADIRRLVEFRRINLLDAGDIREAFDVVFCRNVMIYFDRPVQQRVVSALERRLRPNGYLVISHSESLAGVTHRLKWVAPAVYQRGGA